MYSDVASFDFLIEEAKEFVVSNDRELYRKALEIAESTAYKSRAIIGGERAIDVLSGNKTKRYDTYNIELWTGQPYKLACDIVDAISEAYVSDPFIPYWTVCAETKIKNNWLIIWVNTRIIANIFLMGKYRNVELRSLLTTIEAPGIFGTPVSFYMNSDILLIYLSSICYQPLSASRQPLSYLSAIEAIDTIIGIYKIGGRETDIKKTTMDHKLKTICVELGSIIVDIGRPAIISNVPKDTIMHALRAYGNLSSMDHHVDIPTDYFFKKYTIYSEDRNGRKQLLDVYNSTSYECVPFVYNDGVKHAGLFVSFRFCLIEAFLVKIVEKISGGNLANRYNDLIARSYAYWKQIKETILINPSDIFTTEFIDGVYLESNIKAKKISDKPIPKYYAALKTAD